jgi:hypothetical protein
MFTVAVVVCAFLIQQGIIGNILPDNVHKLLGNLPATSLAGFTGAYIWGHYDILRRYYLIDLSPNSLYYMWLRLLVSGALAYFIGSMFKTGIDYLIAFGIGSFPVEVLLTFVRTQVRERLKLSGDKIVSEKPTLHLLQGMTTEIIERLHEENIYSVQHLALANPIRLLMKTSYEWTVILDFLDQAFLCCYVEDKISEVRKTGIRGAIELMSIEEDLQSENPHEKELGNQLVEDLAERLKMKEASVKNMIYILRDDPQLQFILSLWEEAFKNEPKTKPTSDSSQSALLEKRPGNV